MEFSLVSNHPVKSITYVHMVGRHNVPIPFNQPSNHYLFKFIIICSSSSLSVQKAADTKWHRLQYMIFSKANLKNVASLMIGVS